MVKARRRVRRETRIVIEAGRGSLGLVAWKWGV